MLRLNRRSFVQGAIALTTTSALSRQSKASPNDTVGVAVLGAGRGSALAQWFARLPDSQVVAVCEVDQSRGQALVERVAGIQGKRPPLVNDFRSLLDNSDVDALVVATPDHWHGPATIRACLASKDVYVEKPCSHNIREGRLMIQAARKNNRIVQVGTNLRASPHYEQAWQLLRQGVIGKVLMVKAINNQRRAPMPHRNDEPTPPGVNYDLWLGPAKQRAFNRNHFHSGWRWLWEYGTGDIGNDGVHQIDLGRWALGLKAPKAVSCSGAKLGWRDGAQETPDAMVVTWEYDDLLYVFEQRDFTPYRMQGHRFDNDNIFYGDDGYMMIDRDGYRVFHKGGEPGPAAEQKWTDQGRHYQNFIDCVKTRNSSELIADIEDSHYSALLCHLGNIAYRTGRRLEFDAGNETFPNDQDACRYLSREYRKGFELPAVG